jgi:hypothetical protein
LEFASLKKAFIPTVDAALEALQALGDGAAETLHHLAEIVAGPELAAVERELSERDAELDTAVEQISNLTEEVERRRAAVDFDGKLVAGLRERMLKLEQCLAAAHETLERAEQRLAEDDHPFLVARCADTKRRIKTLLPSNSPAPASELAGPPPRPDSSGADVGDVQNGSGGGNGSEVLPPPGGEDVRGADAAVSPDVPGEHLAEGERWIHLPSGNLFTVVEIIPVSRSVRLKQAGSPEWRIAAIPALNSGLRWRHLGDLCITPECDTRAMIDGFTCSLHDVERSIQVEWLRKRLGLAPLRDFFTEVRGG